MARIRSIKPDFWTDGMIVQLPFAARLLFIGIWNFADDQGCFGAEPDRIKMQVFPSDPVDIEGLLDLLVAADRIELLTAEDDRQFYRIRNWSKHQRVDKPSKPQFPPRESCRKLAIPQAVRRAVAAKYGCEPGEEKAAVCYYCGSPGSITWWKKNDGKPSGWVSFTGLELDHFEPEAHGGQAVPANIVLACRECNRRKGPRDGLPSLAERLSPSPEQQRTFESTREPSCADRSGAEGSGLDWKGSGAEGSAFDVGSDDLDPVVRDHDRAAPPAPLVELPLDCRRFEEQLYSLGTDKRRLDVRRQLYDALDPRGKGARLRKGAYVKARSPEHLAECCRAVMEDPPRNIDAAIVIVLEKLQDPPKGPTPSEIHKASETERIAEEEVYQRAAKSAGVTWAKANPAEYEPIRLQVESELQAAGDGSFGRMAKEGLLTQRCARAAGFPDFDAWREARRETAA